MQAVKKCHLTKIERLPRCYKAAERILKLVRSLQVLRSSNLRTVMQNLQIPEPFFQKVYAICANVLKYTPLIRKILLEVQLLEKEPILRKECAEILIYEIILGKGYIPSQNKAVLTVLKYGREILKAFKSLTAAGIYQWRIGTRSLIPRYTRVNTLLSTVPIVLAELAKCGYQEVKVSDDISEEGFMEKVKNLTRGKFLVDYHFKDLLVFENGEKLSDLALYHNGHILLQDKSSYLPVHVLNPEPGSVVLDACAAPGVKAVHLVAKMQNRGILYAYERSANRFKDLKNILYSAGVTIDRTFCKDFRSVDPSDPQNSDIRYILVDPPCSGSGMVSRMDSVTDTLDSKSEARLKHFAGFQRNLLKRALKFPSVQKVVYSTCSINEEENEYVVHAALNAFNHQFRLAKIEMDWSVHGFDSYEYGNFCLRCFPEKNLTNGFFVALFERLENNLEHNFCAYNERRRPNIKISSKVLESSVADASFNKESKVNKRDYSTNESKSSSGHYDKEFVDMKEANSNKPIMSTKKTKKRKNVDSVQCPKNKQVKCSCDEEFLKSTYDTFKRGKKVPVEMSNAKNTHEFLALEDKQQFVCTVNENMHEDFELHKKKNTKKHKTRESSNTEVTCSENVGDFVLLEDRKQPFVQTANENMDEDVELHKKKKTKKHKTRDSSNTEVTCSENVGDKKKNDTLKRKKNVPVKLQKKVISKKPIISTKYNTSKRKKNVPVKLSNAKITREFLALGDKQQFVRTANEYVDEDAGPHKKKNATFKREKNVPVKLRKKVISNKPIISTKKKKKQQQNVDSVPFPKYK